ncbi:fungal chitosanase of glycosyl hydrolase group 75-domain-containing protein [Cantharellus anzutake]|uniref:fungal chitosanase of glycosyl hydrolase group 75-domain-containing protein n=1 Tax=Cantharellus anzutake TaxID=1750568 RepID=UPI0019081FBC|nr:fungal chitosanase of glycosyl hydrolase group 75-domain-containing protein [Cantharellus anzutake]KAF8336588.1 fungal chitosanase of glycosyl hydrolase group 75-domain-containing protein [Cantharellus anzutake]
MQRGNLHTVGSGSAALRVQSGPSFPINQGSSIRSTIFTQWQNLKKGAAFVFTADMDIDCDGIDYRCPGNTDGQPQTTYGALSAYSVPWIVIPDSFVSQHSSRLPGNNVAAVLCNGKLFYGILGDTNGDSPEVTGEASYLLGRSCFPSDNLNGGKGHGSADVTYIVFLGQDAVLPPSAINKNYITDFGKLRSMGDSLMKALVNNAGI